MDSVQLIDWDEVDGAEVDEPPVIKIEKNTNPNFEVDLRRLTDQLEANDFVVTKVEYLTEYEQEVNQPEVHVHLKTEQELVEEEELADSEFLKRVGREQRKLIAGQRRPVPPEDISRRVVSSSTSGPVAAVRQQSVISPVVNIRPDVVNSFLSAENGGDGIVWTPIPEVELRKPIPEMEFQEDGYKENQRENGEEIIDRKSIIENKDNTKEFLMGKMLESIENESYYLLHGGNNHNAQMVSEIKETEFSQNRIQRREIKINFPEDNNAGSPPPLPKSPIPQLPVAAEVAAPRVEDEAAMQLVSARPAIVVEFPKKVSDFGIKKTRAQQSAEARIAKEIEEIQFREAELIRTRINIEPELDTQPPAPIDFPEPSFSSNFPSPVVPDILTHQFTNPPSPLPSPLPPAPPHILPSFPVLEKPKVKPLVDSDSDPEPKYTFYKETAVERDVRLATQREEELRREKQQILQQQQQKIPEPELINVKVLELESQVETLPPFVPLETNSVPVLQAKREPLAKLVLSGPAPSAINYTRVPELKIVPSSPLPVKVNETNEMEIILRSPLPLTPTTPNTPTSASIISGKPWTLNSSNSNGNSNWNGGSLKRGSITNERVAVAGPNRQATKGLMAKFLANHGKPMPVFVPKTTIPHVLPLYDFNSNNNGESNAPNHTNGASTNGHSNGPTNGQVEKSKENIVKSEIVKVQNPKHTVKRLSSVENMILEELRNIQGRELELRKERSTIMTKIEENGETAEVSDSVNYSGAWGLFTLIGNDDNNNNSSVC